DRFTHDSPFYREGIPEGIPPAPEGTFGFLTVAAELDRLDREFYPSGGFKLRAARKEWGVFQDGSDISARLHALSGSLFISLPRSILSIQGSSVTSRGPCPLYLRRHLGGERTIRGRDFGMLSGDNSLMLRNELSIPLTFRDISELGNPVILVDLSLFAETGTTWDDGQRLSDQEMFSGFGVSLDFIPQQDWLLKIGAMWNSASNGSFYFDIGTSF
ncbi:MAG TPA: ShlB/FhaC/HecB family hemolysin secretion/activation protein, partial [Candidatus Krumholzibacterium sp.]|nr:ShlB/FhaC/HecB family hemolysin secretion/activation protein [Candidatus Krumholzibacterium sp.]